VQAGTFEGCCGCSFHFADDDVAASLRPSTDSNKHARELATLVLCWEESQRRFLQICMAWCWTLRDGRLGL
jgi:hypothetical protein